MTASENNQLQVVFPYMSGVFDFLESTVQLEGFENRTLLKNVVALVGDIATNYQD